MPHGNCSQSFLCDTVSNFLLLLWLVLTKGSNAVIQYEGSSHRQMKGTGSLLHLKHWLRVSTIRTRYHKKKLFLVLLIPSELDSNDLVSSISQSRLHKSENQELKLQWCWGVSVHLEINLNPLPVGWNTSCTRAPEQANKVSDSLRSIISLLCGAACGWNA